MENLKLTKIPIEIFLNDMQALNLNISHGDIINIPLNISNSDSKRLQTYVTITLFSAYLIPYTIAHYDWVL